MAKIIRTTQTGLTRVFARFGRRNGHQDPRQRDEWQKAHWYESDVCSRGL
jgi:hypothetical protein